MNELEKIRENKKRKLIKKLKENNDKMETKIEVNDDNFEKEVIEKSKEVPVVVDFWAEWCMPCLMLGPALEKAVEESKGKFILARMNVDKNRMTSQKYWIRSIPNVKMFKNGEVADEFIGAIPEPMVKSWLNKNLDKN